MIQHIGPRELNKSFDRNAGKETGSFDFLKAVRLWKYSFSNENKEKNVYI